VGRGERDSPKEHRAGVADEARRGARSGREGSPRRGRGRGEARFILPPSLRRLPH
jgi:hypothetical protein